MIKLAIDANEANVSNRVGSNVYAFHLLCELARLITAKQEIKATVLLASPPLASLPKESRFWHYQVISPAKFFTQFALPIYLFKNKEKFDLFFTPGHYAPRFCPVPYISSVMDLAFLRFPEQFKTSDLLQLKHWTKYSVDNAKKVVTISEFSRQEVVNLYHKRKSDVLVAYPDVSLPKNSASKKELEKFFQKHALAKPYFLFVGTLQPRKNLITLIKAYESFCLENKGFKNKYLPQLVIAGKIGWLAEPILTAINQSKVKDKIVLTGFISDEIKLSLYQQALATLLVGLYEGFGIPALESMQAKALPIVSNQSSLAEVVGKAGLLVNPYQVEAIATALTQAWKMSASEREKYQREMTQQIKKFSWAETGKKVYQLLVETAQEVRDEKQT